MRCLPDVTGPVLETRPFQGWVHDSNRERTREIMKSLKCNVINIWGSSWVPSNVLSLCKIWRVRLSSFSLESLCPWLSSRMVLLGPEGGWLKALEGEWNAHCLKSLSPGHAGQKVKGFSWVLDSPLQLSFLPTSMLRHPWGKPGFQAAEESKGD